MMKKLFKAITLLLVIASGKLASQTAPNVLNYLTPRGSFDYLFDRLGNRIALADLSTKSRKPMGGVYGTLSLPTASCSAGYFNVYYNTSTTFMQSTQTQSVICQVFTDISNFIISPLPNSTKINIFCDVTPTGLAMASSFYSPPLNPTNPNPGIIDGQIYKALTSGVDPYLNIPMTFSGSTNFYHGIVLINPNPQNVISFATWFTGLSGVGSMGYNQLDLYTAVLHEVTHALGFNSLIDYNGTSKYGTANNYYTRYDQFLKDPSGNPLLTNVSTALTCNSFNVGPSVLPIISAATSGCVADNTNCSTAVQYISSNVPVVKVYTPNCFDQLSSLSHFEDMCPTAYTSPSPHFGCTPTPASPGANNMYFTMSNAINTGTCYVKRFLREEERNVLCDLGYTTNFVYLSGFGVEIEGGNNYHLYNASCTPASVVGLNDGMSNGNYVFNTTLNTISIPISTLLSNDLPSTGLSISCVEPVYSNAQNLASASVSGGNVVVNATTGSGLVIVKYYPVNASGVVGNATYIYVQFLSNNCNPVSACNLVQNGGFENGVASPNCGILGVMNGPDMSCWDLYQGNPYVMANGCTSSGGTYNLGVNTLGASSAMSSFNGAGNNRIAALYYSPANGNNTQVIRNSLGSPMVPGINYHLSFMVANVTSAASGYNPPANPSPVVITVATNPVAAFSSLGTFPSGLNVIAQFTVNPGNNWSQVIQNLTFSSPSNLNHNALLIGINQGATQALGILGNSSGVMCYIDEVSLTAAPQPTFNLGSTTICGNASLMNLDQFTSVPSLGSYSGPYVSSSAGQYNFNSPPVVLSPGSYPIAYTYVSGGCTNTQYQFVNISTNTNLLTMHNNHFCSGSSYSMALPYLLDNTMNLAGATFSVNGTYVPSFTFSFPPSGTYTVTVLNNTTTLCNHTATAIVSSYTTPLAPTLFFNGSITTATANICLNYPNNQPINAAGFTNELSNIFLWQPGNIFAQNVSLSPIVSTVYTLSVYNYTECPVTVTAAINVSVNCCYPSYPARNAFQGVTLPSAVNGSISILNDVSVPPASSATLMAGDFLMGENTKIIVPNTATLVLDGSHLYSCSDKTWQGIVVEDGGYVKTASTTGPSNLIEDANIAIDVSNHVNSTRINILDISNTIFNKNYIGINVYNYHRSSSAYANVVKLTNCVFTSRTLQFDDTHWPTTGSSSASSGMGAELFHAFTSVNGVAPPYMSQGLSVATVKIPYASVSSFAGVQLNGVGATGGGNYYGLILGDDSSPSNFNIFDAQGSGIFSNNSNIRVVNNVFQNMQYSPNASSGLNLEGSGIKSKYTPTTYGSTDLNAANTSVGNRFWDCYTGVSGTNIYDFHIYNNSFRSTQDISASGTGPFPGNIGINLNTNHFRYFMLQNEFTNINTCINIPVVTAPTCSICASGTYAEDIVIQWNKFNPGTSTGSYIKQAINISSTNSYPFSVAPDLYNPSIIGTFIENNDLTNVQRGVALNGFTGFRTYIKDNTITIRDAAPSGITQHGIDLSNVMSTSSLGGQTQIVGNQVAGPSISTQNSISLVYNSLNTGNLSPFVNCNKLSSSYQGFVFNGNCTPATNLGTRWLGNDMDNLTRALALTNSGKIGQQGDAQMGSSNHWVTNFLYGTWADQYSHPNQSPLYVVANTAQDFPPNNFGLVFGQVYGVGNGIYPNSIGPYSCGIPYARVIPDPVEPHYGSENGEYIAKTNLYRFLLYNEDVRNDKDNYDLLQFYNDVQDEMGPMYQYALVEEALYTGDFRNARTILAAISPANAVEENYSTFYSLYADYQELNARDETFDEAQQYALTTLANLCPATNGSCIYQARALYNTVYNTVVIYDDCPSDDDKGARKAHYQNDNADADAKQAVRILKAANTWSVDMFPNPANGQLSFVSKQQNESLNIVITDIAGRVVLKQSLKTNGFIATLDLPLATGAYMATITNADNKTITKKLLIAR